MKNYFTRWVKEILSKRETKEATMSFIKDKIILRFRAPYKITTDNAKVFSSIDFPTFCFNYGIVLSHSSKY